MKLEYAFVKTAFEKAGCELLETEYVNAHTKMRYRCECGNVSSINWGNFSMGQRCKACADARRLLKPTSTSKSLDFDYVESEFKKSGCQLLESDYKNNHTKMEYICSCGIRSTTTWDAFRNRRRCKECFRTSKTLKFGEVKKYFEQQGCSILENEWSGCFSKIRFVCHCGRRGEAWWSNFCAGQRCRKCGKVGLEKKLNEKYEHVKEFFTEVGCALLSKEYKNWESPLKYICSCGKTAKTAWGEFKDVRCCKWCGRKKQAEKVSRKDKDMMMFERRVKRKCRSALKTCLRLTGQKKHNKTFELLGYGSVEIIDRITGHPNWKRVKGGKWHLDHIFPIQAFMHYEIYDVKIINALDNLQPLTEYENISKNDKYDRRKFEAYLISKGHVWNSKLVERKLGVV